MSVEFDDNNSNFATRPDVMQASETSKMVGLVVKWGLASSEEGANKVLLGVAVASVVLTLIVIFRYVL